MKAKLTQANFAAIIFAAFYWLYMARMGLFNGVVIAAALWGIYVVIRRSPEVLTYFKESQFLYLYLLLWIPVLISAIGSLTPSDSWRIVLNLIRFLFIGALAILLTQESLDKVKKWTVFFVALVSVDAICEWLTGYHLLGKSPDLSRVRGLFSPGNQLGYYLATIAPVMFYQVFKTFEAKNQWRYGWLILLFATVLTVFISSARAGWITIMMGLGIFFVWMVVQRKISLKLVSAISIVLIVIGAAVSQLPVVKDRYANPNGAAQLELGSYEWLEKFSSNRLVLWEFAWHNYQQNPVIGAGVGSFEKTFLELPEELKNGQTNPHFVHLHGLEVLSETGTIGFICYLFVMLWLLQMIMTSKKFPVWLIIAFLAMMPINMHVAFYRSFWSLVCWAPLILGLRERYLQNQQAKLENGHN